MIRAVLDTNVLVSALLKPASTPRNVLRMGLAGTFQIVVSPAVFNEYQFVLPRPELKLAPKEVADALEQLRTHAHWVEPTDRITSSPHEPDNRFLECARASQAAYLITGNKRHFPRRLGTTKVIGPREFLEILTPDPKR